MSVKSEALFRSIMCMVGVKSESLCVLYLCSLLDELNATLEAACK